MLAEPDFFIEAALPQTLQGKANILAGEPSWPAADALQVVEWLAANDYEVVGVEMWRNKEGKPLFVASSNYSPFTGAEDTPESIAWCAYKASQFIVRFSHEPGAVFNITSQRLSAKLNKAGTAPSLPIYSRARLITDKRQSEGARCFDVGYIIEVYPNSKYEVEFSDLNGITTAQIIVSGEELELAPPTYDAPTRNPNAPRLSIDPVKEQKI